ncbi:hypothetical protein BK653_05885 [Pseudomonas brassicacearum]|uniref:DUF3969 family protein n=1 Tax=Pseudomonas brassicacearum TaxID=930166 RepID=UPI000F473250|nr:DUF3969 family protein [Pseudomonas brassicacearum]ROM71409.1 hypothetical protein BK653_05885 [Pseudomonas brassicacearum]
MKNMSLVLEVFEAEESARFLSALSIGLLTSVQRGAMSLEEAERLFFSPRSSKILKEKGISSEFSELVMDCCELEDVLSLVPSKFDDNLQFMLDKFIGFLKASKARETDLNFVELS